MEVSDLVLWIARLLVLVLMYGFLLVLVFALITDARAARPADHACSPIAPVSHTPAATPPPAPPPQAESSILQLEVLTGTLPVTGRKYTLFSPLEIGRGTNCEISIPNHFVSSRHARIFPQQNAWMLEDLGSTNGTLVNGEPLDGARPLHPGDHVMVGDTEFVVSSK